MKIVQSFLTNNPCYKSNLNPGGDQRYLNFQKNGPSGLMLHSVGCPQPSAAAFISSWNTSSHNDSCVNAFIDANTGTVYQTLPWNYRAWHAGGSANNTHIGVEMCEPDCIKYVGGSTFTCNNVAKAKKMAEITYNAAVELFAMLCNKYNLDPMKDGVIISHKEGNQRKVASNHGDPEHLWNQLSMGYTMNEFRKDVKTAMGASNGDSAPTPAPAPSNEHLYRVRKSWADASSQIGAYKLLDNAKAACKFGYTVYDENGKAVYPIKENSSKNNLEDFVRAVQTAVGAAVDGIAGPETLSKTPTVSATKNNRHLVVRAIQKRLYDLGYTQVGLVDGVAGEKFTAAVQAFQRDNGCVADGEVTGGNKTWQKLLGLTEVSKPVEFKPYMVQVTADALNYREGPGSNYKVRGTIRDHGSYTIVEESNGWGRLKSGAGWISLSYTKKI